MPSFSLHKNETYLDDTNREGYGSKYGSTSLFVDETKFKTSKFWTKTKLAILIVFILASALALGLGLGLGLRPSKEEPSNQDGCLKEMDEKFDPTKRGDGTKWLAHDCLAQPTCADGLSKTLLLVSIDGFRASYFDRKLTPVLQKIRECGVSTDYTKPVFPTKTFPNHYSIVTGLYPESHGIVDNTFYDPEYKDDYFAVARDTKVNAKWWGGDPIWLTAQDFNKTSAAVFWPGTDSRVKDRSPNICFDYDRAIVAEERIDKILSLLEGNKVPRPDVLLTYLEQVDDAGHAVGPYEHDLDGNLTAIDKIIGQLMDGLVDRNLVGCVNIMIVSDHGMSPLDCSRVVSLGEQIDPENHQIYTGTFGRVSSKYVIQSDNTIKPIVNGASPDEMVEKLQCEYYNNTRDWYTHSYKKEDFPKRYHYGNNRRIDEVLVTVEDEWVVSKTPQPSWWACTGGNHGFDNGFESMRSTFMAYGPAFKQGIEVDPFESIELYNIMAEVLGIDSSPNNGTKGSLSHLLKSPRPVPNPPQQGIYEKCPFPPIEDWEQRRNMSDCSCEDLGSLTSKSLDDLDEQLNLTDAEIEVSKDTHLHKGVPALSAIDESTCLLTQTDYITGYSNVFHMPLWTAFAARGKANGSEIEGCLRPDLRLSTNEAVSCSEFEDPDQDILPGILYPSDFSNTIDRQLDAHISSNIVPMFRGFKDGIWKFALSLVEEYSQKYIGVKVLTGPVFDYNADGLVDQKEDIKEFVNDGRVPVPTHYYMVLTKCKTEACNQTDSLAYILPHKSSITTCKYNSTIVQFEYVTENRARIRDVELLTGLRFFSELLTEEQARLVTNFPTSLWPRLSWIETSKEECPTMTQTECPSGYNADSPPVLLISLDGFKPDYLNFNKTPTLEKLYRCGTNTPYIHSIYPSLTFPNHYSIVTGLYPESSGIVDNNMYDMSMNESFRLGSEESMNPEWWKGEPLWNTVTKNGKSSMTFFWPGSDVPIQNMRPDKYEKYNNMVRYDFRVDTLLKWLSGSEGKVPDFLTLYFSKVDKAGHESGPGSAEVIDTIAFIDDKISTLMDGIYRLNLHKCLNVIIVSDHGMSDISCERTVLVADAIGSENTRNIYMYSGGAPRISNKYKYKNNDIIHLAEKDRVPEVEMLKNMSCFSDKMKVFDKTELPKRLHYVTSERIDNVVMLMQDRWTADRFSPWCQIKGNHAWDPTYKSMWAFFLAYGPSFKSQFTAEPFENIELYNLMADILNVTAVPNNGTAGSLHHLLKNPPNLPALPPSGAYDNCLYPTTDEDYESRVNGSTCMCEMLSNSTSRQYDDNLDFTQSQKNDLENKHISHGEPTYDLEQSQLCKLHQTDFVSGYNKELRLPSWTAFEVNPSKSETMVPDCVRPDPRIEREYQTECDEYDLIEDTGFTKFPLFSPGFSTNNETVWDSLTQSNFVPMMKGFADIWKSLMTKIMSWSDSSSVLHCVTGPIFDHDGDGHGDSNITEYISNSSIPFPSHFYAIVLRCPSSDPTNCVSMTYELQAFVLPHMNGTSNCLDEDEYFYDNRARIRDIELLTNLNFLTANKTQQQIQKRVQLPGSLWT